MPNGELIPLAPLLAKLGVMLTLALMVERFLTIFNWLINRLFMVQVTGEQEAIAKENQKLQSLELAIAEAALLQTQPAAATADPREIEPNPTRAQPDSRFDVAEMAAPDRLKVTKEFWLQILGTLVAVAGCYYMKFSIWIFVRWAIGEGSLESIQSTVLEYIFTGIIIGAGSKPVNFLMNFLINRRLVVTREKAAEEAKPEAAPEAKPVLVPKPKPAPDLEPPKPKSIEQIVGFVYDGGDRPERLQHSHLFKKPIDMIVYHHTAMHSDAPFEELTKEFDRKGWLTGYNCVVFKDGAIRVLCRWDRFGNHAVGYNNHSLGVALQGNFETNPKVPFSNHNGRLGILRPTAEQVDAAARVTALWALMHQIEVAFPEKTSPTFPKGIIPHMYVAQKACPGGNFPYAEFKQAVERYAKLWKADEEFQTALNAFKAQPMVMA
jgi:hypothetical protein